jgi:hypothetical protein
MQMKSENYKILQCIMISYTEIVVKKLNLFHILLTNRTSPKKFHITKKETIRFVGKVMFKLAFESYFFYSQQTTCVTSY